MGHAAGTVTDQPADTPIGHSAAAATDLLADTATDHAAASTAFASSAVASSTAAPGDRAVVSAASVSSAVASSTASPADRRAAASTTVTVAEHGSDHDHPRGDLVLAGAASHAHDDGHGHSHGSARSAWMLLMPVLAIFLIAPPALGADSVNRAGGRTVASEQRQDQVIKTKFPPLPAGSVVPLRMADVATRAAWDSTNSLDGRTLELTGFVVHDAAGVYVARLVITCCAADAMPVKARLVGSEGLADDQWITVTGKVRPNSAMQADNYVPVFDVESVKKIAVPGDPYEY
ncbi:TIGR03943 family putative permease subunit [Kutzneria buriramensis]|uniref:TIGR03943 family putative permease subunit n=1 Tax=Kutzneria buriramensis TaxID=1045776 RepID=UPI002482ED90|nr:TIGR03943 family protein [Kutzneria buriramensis]